MKYKEPAGVNRQLNVNGQNQSVLSSYQEGAMKKNSGKRSEKNNHRMDGFTLIEIMVVVMIIGMLATMVGVRVMDSFEKAKRKATAGQIRNLMTALDTYYMDNSRYPSTGQGLKALVAKPSGSPSPKNYPANGYLSTSEVPLDPWDNEYIYFSPGSNGEPYTIQSYGKDLTQGGEGDNADIESWDLGGA